MPDPSLRRSVSRALIVGLSCMGAFVFVTVCFGLTWLCVRAWEAML